MASNQIINPQREYLEKAYIYALNTVRKLNLKFEMNFSLTPQRFIKLSEQFLTSKDFCTHSDICTTDEELLTYTGFKLNMFFDLQDKKYALALVEELSYLFDDAAKIIDVSKDLGTTFLKKYYLAA